MEWFAAAMILLIVAVWVYTTASRTRVCTCVWFQNDEGPYRAIADLNCRRHGGREPDGESD